MRQMPWRLTRDAPGAPSPVRQVANTLYAWIHPEKHLVGWLNLLNAAFGIGTLTAPAVVALLATLSRSHTQGLLQALLLLPGLVLIVSAGGGHSPYDTAKSRDVPLCSPVLAVFNPPPPPLPLWSGK